MKRQGPLCGLAAVLAMAAWGCVRVNGRWVPRQSVPQEPQADATTKTPDPPLQQEADPPSPEPAPAADAVAEGPSTNAAEAVADFVRRLRSEDRPGGEAASGSTAVDVPPTRQPIQGSDSVATVGCG